MMSMPADKPPYRVPLMSEIATLPPNGFSIVSTFSGCGGSCVGFKMLGFKVLWASEFIPAAQETYRANHPGTILDTRDIRTVQPQDILRAIGKDVGNIDVLEGSPPCASFSTAGKRHKGWGHVKAYSDSKQRTDDLFFEYARLLKGLQPKVFVAENVSGLVKGVAKGYFKEILSTLKACGYVVEAKLLDAQWLGVPQMRQRIIFMGVRNDLGLRPVFPKPLPYRYSVRDALPWIMKHQHNQGIDRPVEWKDSRSIPANTVGIGPSSGNGRSTLIEATRPRAYLDTYGAFGNDGDCTDTPAPTVLSDSVGTHWIEQETDISRYAIGKEWAHLRPGEQSEKYRSLQKAPLDKPCPTVTCPPDSTFSPTAVTSAACITHPTERRKFSIEELKRICAFPDDFILMGTYAQRWERLGRAVPPMMMRAIAQSILDDILRKLPKD
jgi:DNA (cytosine-5)-methyltransferase 1